MFTDIINKNSRRPVAITRSEARINQADNNQVIRIIDKGREIKVMLRIGNKKTQKCPSILASNIKENTPWITNIILKEKKNFLSRREGNEVNFLLYVCLIVEQQVSFNSIFCLKCWNRSENVAWTLFFTLYSYKMIIKIYYSYIACNL